MSAEWGLVIGKFYPPHAGHHHLVQTAQTQCARVTVIVCAREDDEIPGHLRAQWMQETHPAADVRLVEDRYDPHDSELWARLTVQWLGRPPDTVFTSENYGSTYASFLGCRHVLVDRDRQMVPCSGTAVRTAPYEQWQYLSPAVRAWYAKRVCVLGAESTGSTTLARALADHYHTVWVPEYGREYSERKFTGPDRCWHEAEFIHIAEEQTRRENWAAREANRVLICDTNAFATRLWRRRYLGDASDQLAALASQRLPDLYLLTGDEIPFVQDGFRDGEQIRHEMQRWFIDALQNQPVPWLLVRGDVGTRVKLAAEAIDRLFSTTLPRA